MHGPLQRALRKQRLRHHLRGRSSGQRVRARALRLRRLLTMFAGLSNLARLGRRVLLGSSCFVCVGAVASHAHAQSTIRVPGQRPAYSFELEPHVLLTPFGAPDYPSSEGYGLGVRGTVELAPEGFIPKLNDSVGIGFGL